MQLLDYNRSSYPRAPYIASQLLSYIAISQFYVLQVIVPWQHFK